MPSHPRGFDLHKARTYLRKADPRLGAWMRWVGAFTIDGWDQPFETVDALARSILYQQLSGKAAATIVGRVEAALGAQRISAKALARVTDADLRACGVSGNKILALRDLARRAEAGEVPSARRLLFMDDSQILETLTAVRGIGCWTVQMLLMFRLGRPDVLPIDDLGVRKGVQIVDVAGALPSAREMAVRGACWAPYRSLASFYLWRIADLSRKKAALGAARRNPYGRERLEDS